MAKQSRYAEMVDTLLTGQAIEVKASEMTKAEIQAMRVHLRRTVASIPDAFKPDDTELQIEYPADTATDRKIRFRLVAPKRKICYNVVSRKERSHDTGDTT